MPRRPASLAALLLPAAILSLAPVSAHAQMPFEIKVQFQNGASHAAAVRWVNQDTGATLDIPGVPANASSERIEHWMPLPDAPTQRHQLSVTLPGNRGCQTTLELKMTFGMPGTGVRNAFTCTFTGTTRTGMSCTPLATSAFDPATGTGGACDARIRFGG